MSDRGFVNTAIKASKKNRILSLIFIFILVKNHINAINVTMLVIHLQILPSTRKINTNKLSEKQILVKSFYNFQLPIFRNKSKILHQ